MERQVIFRDRQELQSADLNNIETFADEAIGHVVTDAITGERQIVGLVVSQKSATEIEVAPGRLWDGTAGKIYRIDQAQTISVFSWLPLVDQRYLAISVIGQEQELDIEPRDFLVDLQSGQTQPEAVAMERKRVAVVNVEAGVESPTPQRPASPTGYTLIAYVLLGTGGIVEVQTGEVPTLARAFETHQQVKALKGWKDQAEPRIATLASDVAGLAESLKGVADRGMIRELAADMARLKEFMNLPDTFSAYGADYLLDEDESDTQHPDYYARAEEGMRFPWAAQEEAAISLFNPYETAVKVSGNFALPAHSDVARLVTTGYAGELAISQYQYQTHQIQEGSVSRERLRYGPTRTICTNSQEWRTGRYDPATNIFRASSGETWAVAPEDVAHLNEPHYLMRQTQCWIDSYDEPYWYVDTTDHTLNGAQIAQTLLNSQNGWLTKLGLQFTRKAADGVVYVHICETEHGLPNLQRCVGSASIAPADIKAYPEETRIALPRPVYLEAGKRYALVITTAGDHRLAIVAGENYTQGTLFYSLDGDYFQGDFTKDLMMSLYFAAFANPRTVVELAPLSLAGGIADIDILTEAFVPPSTELVFEYQKDGVWHPVAQTDNSPLMGLPALVHFRAVFIGSTDLMPGLGLGVSRTLVGRQATTFRHISTARTTPAPSSNIDVQLRLEYFDDAKHDITCALLIDAATVAPASVTIQDEPGGVRHIFHFAPGTPTSEYRIQVEGSATSALDVFHVAHRIDIAH